MSGPIGDNTARASGVIASAGGGGKIGQVLCAIKTDIQSFTSASWVGITDLSLTITPASTSSKILWSYSVTGMSVQAYNTTKIAYGDATDLTTQAIGDAASSRLQGTGGNMYEHQNSVFQNNVAQGIDNPATTSATTYEVHFWQTSSTGFVNKDALDSDDATNVRTISSLTLMEILE